jgi:hypothetical protein
MRGRQIVATAAYRHAREAILDFSHTDCSGIDAVRHLLSQETDNGWVRGRTNKLGDDIRVEQNDRSPNSGGRVSGARPRGGMSSSTPCSGPNNRRATSTTFSRGSVPCRARAVRNNSRASSSSERRCSAARALSRLCKALSTFRISKLTTGPPLFRVLLANASKPFSGRQLGGFRAAYPPNWGAGRLRLAATRSGLDGRGLSLASG